jgi:hypothetical protein
MATTSDEYNTLREELIEHQKSRTAILSLALTASATLFAASVSEKFGNPYLPLFALILLSSARVQITQTEYGAQRIASYIRVMLEEEGNNPDLHWETGSYEIRRTSISQQKRVWNISPVTPIEWILSLTGLVAIGLAMLISLGLINGQGLTVFSLPLSFYVSIGSSLVWLIFWIRYGKNVAELQSMQVDEKEAAFWRKFKSTHKIKRRNKQF